VEIPIGYSEAVYRYTETQCPTEKGQKDKLWSTKHYTEKYRLSNTTPTKNWKVLRNDELSSSALVAPGVTLARNPMVSHERGNDGIVMMTNGTYPWVLQCIILGNKNEWSCSVFCYLILSIFCRILIFCPDSGLLYSSLLINLIVACCTHLY